MDKTELATRLAELERVEEQFDTLVHQIVENQRQAATGRIMEQLGATPSSVAHSVGTLDQALEKIEHNLKAQYAEFFAAQVSLREDNLTESQLRDYVALVSDERVQDYLAGMRTIQQIAGPVIGDLLSRLMHSAVSGSSNSHESRQGT